MIVENPAAHLGAFFGSHLSPDSLDAYVARVAKPHDWKLIGTLYERKWFGYRFISPGAGLFVFADRYRTAYKEISGRLLARKRTPTFTNEDALHPNSRTPMKPADVCGLWMAVCIADDLGIPYDFYCRTAMEIAHRWGWQYLPRPTQMYGDRLVAEIDLAWKLSLTDRLPRTTSPHYSLKNYCQHPWQHAYMDFLIAAAMARPNPRFALVNVMFDDNPQVLPSYAAKKIGLDLVREVSSYAKKRATPPVD